jgi:hypothetical protein
VKRNSSTEMMNDWYFVVLTSMQKVIDLEKAYDKMPRNIMWWTLQKHKVSTKYIILIKDMYDNVVTSVRTSDGDTNDFLINI